MVKKFAGTKSMDNPSDAGGKLQQNQKGAGAKLGGKKDFTKKLGKVQNGTEFKPNLKNNNKQKINLKNGNAAANPKEFLENIKDVVQVQKGPIKKKGGPQNNKNQKNLGNKEQSPVKSPGKKNKPQSPEKSPNLVKESQDKPQNVKKNNLGAATNNQNAKNKKKLPKTANGTAEAPATPEAGTKKQKSKKTPQPSPSLQEAPEFNEEKFNEVITQENAETVITALKKQVSKEITNMKNQVFSDYKYLINVACFKIPNCPKRIVRLTLKNPLVAVDGEVCLIVKDLQKGLKVDYEPTIQHYEDLLKKKGVKGIKTIIPFNQIKTEYRSYEMKEKLSNLYDCYLVDGAISKHVGAFLGKKFQRTKCTLYPVRMEEENLAQEIKKASTKTSFRQLEKGPMISIPVGIDKHTPKQVAENILEVVKQLKKVYPGGLANIRNIYARINLKGTSSFPLYVNMGSPPAVTPYVIGPNEQKLNKLKAKAGDILKKFTVSRTGALIPVSKDVAAQKRPLNEGESEEKGPVQAKKQKLQEKQTGKQQKGKGKNVALVANKDEEDSDSASDEDLQGTEGSANDLDADSEDGAEVQEDSSEEEDDDEKVEENDEGAAESEEEGEEEGDDESAEDDDEDEDDDDDDDDDEDDDDDDDEEDEGEDQEDDDDDDEESSD